MTSVRDILNKGVERLARFEPRTARLEALIFLEDVLGVERAMFYAYPEREVTAEQEQRFLTLIERRRRGEPVAYILGQQEFYGRCFFVDRRVLIPRPETELLVESALKVIRQRLNRGEMPLIADIGTGSGAIPITIALEESRLTYLYATDISADALAVTRSNCLRYHVEPRVRLLHGDLLAPLPEPVDIIIANLPYVGTEEIALLTPDVYNYEPHLALFSGPYGLDLLRRLLAEARQSTMLRKSATILLEIGYQQREAIEEIIHVLWPRASVTWEKDYSGWDRLVIILTS